MSDQEPGRRLAKADPKVLILGAYGQIARVATDLFLKDSDVRLTLYLRKAKRLKLSGHADRVRIIEGDVLDSITLDSAIAGQDVADGTGILFAVSTQTLRVNWISRREESCRQ